MPHHNDSIPRFSQARAVEIAREHFGLNVQARELSSYVDQNIRLEDASGARYVLKIANSAEPRDEIDLQQRIMEKLGQVFDEGAIPRLVTTLSGDEIVDLEGADGHRHLVRLLTYLPGVFLADVDDQNPELLLSLGEFLGRLNLALADFSHPAMHRYHRWDLRHVDQVVGEHLGAIDDAEGRDLVARWRARIQDFLPTVESGLRRSVIHNDANDSNVLVSTAGGGPPRATGLIDFGDAVHSYLAAEAAVAAAYVMFGQADPLTAAAHVISGYHQVHSFADNELEAFLDLIGARLVISVSVSAHEKKKNPDNEHISISEAPAWELLHKLDQIDRGFAVDLFRKACRMSSSSSSTDEILDKRRRFVGPSLSISYRDPLHIVRGEMQYLYDESGRAYLDCVNNVCHVGHCHPKVVKAAQDQMAVLNTNTRYLHDNLVCYAERLVSTLPDPLNVCYFVNSGSEANDLAVRLARAHTGGSEMIVVDGAYHGHLSSLIELSPYKFAGPGGGGLTNHVRVVTMPDVYRGPYKASDRNASWRYAEDVAVSVREISRAGGRPAAFFCESMLGCGGQIELPAGYLAEANRYVREAGGVVVADEVQVGFGRVGSHFWAFELQCRPEGSDEIIQEAVPDIVTLGKPIGNGHPMAAVVTTPEIAASFNNGMEFFSTFGGNPVSCAVGLAVLDAIEEDGLQDNALRVGNHLLGEFARLKEKHELIGDVRGRGLFLGIELVRDHETLEPAAEEASALIDAMKDRGVLLSTDGPLHNVIKMKPPICFSMEDADRVVLGLDEVLGDM